MRAGDVEVVGRAKVVTAEGRASTRRGVTYTWLACTVCGELVLARGLLPDQSRLDEPDYAKAHGRPCRMTPKCSGRHLKGAS